MALDESAASIFRLRTELLRALLWVLLGLTVISLVTAASSDIAGAIDVLAGGIIVLTPSLWLALKVSSQRGSGNAAVLALAKYTLSGAGFALWFALNPTSSGPLVMAGTVFVLISTPVATAICRSGN